MSDPKTKTPDATPADEPQRRGRIVKNQFAVALSDACEVFDGIPEHHRGLLLDNLTALYRPAEPVQPFDPRDQGR